ncbi:MAG TPA: Tol-Pal system beta propeller repeat protein TolB [Myxococcota bacterium]|nr:Tol-Pal system beta propeller repeat protein TolB [Myxococcota bacterium]
MALRLRLRRELLRRTVLRRIAPFWLLLCAGAAAAQERPAVVVNPGGKQTYRAALQRFADHSPRPAGAEEFRDALGRALEFSQVFELVNPRAFLGPETTESLETPIVCPDWSQIGADALVQGQLARDPSLLTANFRVWDPSRCATLVQKSYRQPATADPNALAKRIADDVVEAFVGVRGVSATEIAFVSNRKGNGEIFVMAADGSGQRAATANRSINNFPSWSPDGDAIVYTSYRQANRPLLFISSRGRGRPGRLLPRLPAERAEYRGVFSPKGDRVALVLSDEGAAEIYSARPDGSDLQRLTRHRSIDVSPTWSPDGSRIAFVSDRTGAPQVYVMDSGGGEPRRLTFQGSYNTNPTWSPDGKWIAYESRIGGQFDLWLIDPEGQVNQPIVQHPRNDEGPSWAPNSRMLAFSSRRFGRAEICVVDLSGEKVLRLTQNAGDNTAPAWGPFPR